MDLGIRNRVALVTGSHRGTGQVIAQRLAAEGVRVLSHGPTADSVALAAQNKSAAGQRHTGAAGEGAPLGSIARFFGKLLGR